MDVTGTNDAVGESAVFRVVVNGDGQYSIWPSDRENPLGWTDAGKEGTKESCLAYIETTWDDMRPLSLRRRTTETRQT